MPRQSLAYLTAVVLPLSLTGCEGLLPVTCTTEVAPAVTVEVRDSVTGEPAAAGASGFVRDGSFTADLKTYDDAGSPWMYGPDERPGTYTVVVQKPGYREWKQENVRARDGRCHVEGVTLQAKLQRSA